MPLTAGNGNRVSFVFQVARHMISSDCISSSTSSFWNSNSTFCNNQNVHMLNKGVQAGKLLEFNISIEMQAVLKHIKY